MFFNAFRSLFLKSIGIAKTKKLFTLTLNFKATKVNLNHSDVCNKGNYSSAKFNKLHYFLILHFPGSGVV